LGVLEHCRQVLEHFAGQRLLLLEHLQFWNVVRYDAEQTAFGSMGLLIRVVPGVQSFPGTIVAAENGWRRCPAAREQLQVLRIAAFRIAAAVDIASTGGQIAQTQFRQTFRPFNDWLDRPRRLRRC